MRLGNIDNDFGTVTLAISTKKNKESIQEI